MASVMAIKNDVFGSCIKGINVSLGGAISILVLLRVEIFKAYLERGSCSKSAVEMGDGARYRKCFLVLFRYFGSY